MSELSEDNYYCPDCNFILTETDHVIDKSGGYAYFVCGKCGSEYTIEFKFETEPKLKKDNKGSEETENRT